jgi:hypothetical protein
MRKLTFLSLAIVALGIAGCGGAKVLKKPEPFETKQPLAIASDEHLVSSLDWVVVRAGPGTWAKNADWDEYLLRFKNLSGSPIQITKIRVYDSLGTRIETQTDRKSLVKGSKETKRRYRESKIKVKAGMGTATMLAAGTAVGVIGYGMAATSTIGGMGAAGGAGAGAGAAGAFLLAAPIIAFVGIKRGVNNSKVNKEIIRRETMLPLKIPASQELSANLFFPLSPSPTHVEIIYTNAEDEYRLLIDTQEALGGLHLVPNKK